MGLLGIGSQMQIGEDDLAAAQLLPFGGQRLFHLHDQFGALKYLLRACNDLGAGGDVFLVGKRQRPHRPWFRLRPDALARSVA